MSENMKITSFFFAASAGDIRGLPQMYEEYVTMTNISSYYFRNSTTDTPQRRCRSIAFCTIMRYVKLPIPAPRNGNSLFILSVHNPISIHLEEIALLIIRILWLAQTL